MIRIVELKTGQADRIKQLSALMSQLSGSSAPDQNRLEQMLASSHCHLLLAEQEEQIVGMLTLAHYDTLGARRGWIEDVVVDESWRGKGIGRALVVRAKEIADAEGVESLSLTSSPHRIAARALYRQEGFQPVETTVFRICRHACASNSIESKQDKNL